jgi:hypothetical protein
VCHTQPKNRPFFFFLQEPGENFKKLWTLCCKSCKLKWFGQEKKKKSLGNQQNGTKVIEIP